MTKSSTPTPTKEQFLASCPVRLVDAQPMEAGEGKWRLRVPISASRWPSWLMRLPADASKTFELDAIGKRVWDSCDGKTPIRSIIQQLAAEYNLNLREAEVATVAFLNTLARKGLIRVGEK